MNEQHGTHGYNYITENEREMPVYNTCPGCGNDKTYQRYIESKTRVQVSNDVGRCKNKKGCGYWYTPSEYFRQNNITPNYNTTPSFIPNNVFLKSLNNHEENNLFIYLSKQFGEIEATKAMNKYFVGTSNKFPGASVFWQIDSEDKKRTGRIVLFDKETGRYNVSLLTSKGWVHRLIKTSKFNLVECLFGEHLLKIEPDKPVVMVYSENTAILGSVLYPAYLWLAMPNRLESPNKKTLCSLSGRNVTWFPEYGFDRLLEFTKTL